MSDLCFSLIFVCLTVSQATIISRRYSKKLEFDNKMSNNEFLGEYKVRSLCECSAVCHKNCTLFGYNPKLKKCRTHKKTFTSEMSEKAGWRYYTYSNHYLPIDCKDLLENGRTNSSAYEIYPSGTRSHPVRVYCDMDTMDGGWTAIQKREDGSLSFEKTWTEYKNGFGLPERNMWIGNDVIHLLTKGKKSSLYISITLLDGSRLYQLYDEFSVSDEAEKYKLFLKGNTIGTLGDSMVNTVVPEFSLSNMYFSTWDSDNDLFERGNCAQSESGGWWFNQCHQVFLNGPWSPRYWYRPWSPTIKDGTSVKKTMMLIKRH